MNTKRSEAAHKAHATRKANKLAQQQYDTEQQERRAELLETADKATKEFIDNCMYTPFCVIDDEYEQLLAEWEQEKTEEVKQGIRHLLRKEVSAALILGYIEQELDVFVFGVFSMEINPEKILEDVLLEDEFLGMNQPTSEARQKMWALTATSTFDRVSAQINEVNAALKADANN